MKAEIVYLGSWFVRTKLHLREFYDFARYSFTELELDAGYLNKLKKELGFEEIEYRKDLFDRVIARTGRITVEYEQDGIVFLKARATSIHDDITSLKRYLEERLIRSMSYIYSKGAPVPKILSDIKTPRPILVVCSKASKDEAEEIFRKAGDRMDITARTGSITRYAGDYLTVIVDAGYRPGKEEFYDNIAKYTIFFSDYQSTMHKFLRMHRIVWDDISKIREKETIRYKELPGVRDILLDLKKNISFVKSRMYQMDNFMMERKRVCDTAGLDRVMKSMGIYDFEDFRNMQNYMVDLWVMTENYADTTIHLVSMLYQENEQLELNTLQIIFTVGVVASLLALGAMPGAIIQFTDPVNQVMYTGQVASFDYDNLVLFGAMALLGGIVVYIIFHYIFKEMRAVRLVNVLKGIKKGGEGIRDMFRI